MPQGHVQARPCSSEAMFKRGHVSAGRIAVFSNTLVGVGRRSIFYFSLAFGRHIFDTLCSFWSGAVVLSTAGFSCY